MSKPKRRGLLPGYANAHGLHSTGISNQMVLARREQAQPPEPETMWFDHIVDQITNLVEGMPRNTRMKLEISEYENSKG